MLDLQRPPNNAFSEMWTNRNPFAKNLFKHPDSWADLKKTVFETIFEEIHKYILEKYQLKKSTHMGKSKNGISKKYTNTFSFGIFYIIKKYTNLH